MGAHTTIAMVEAMCFSIAKKVNAASSGFGSAGVANAARLVDRSVTTAAVVGAGVSLGLNCMWVSHALALLGFSFSMESQATNAWQRLLSMGAMCLLAVLALVIVSQGRHGLLGSDGVHSRYRISTTGAGGAAAAAGGVSSGSSRKGKTHVVVYWPGVRAELASPYALRLLLAGLVLALGFVLSFLVDMASLRDRALVAYDPAKLGIAAGVAWLCSCALVFCVVHMHGARHRVTGALLMGALVLVMHMALHLACSFHAMTPAQLAELGLGELLIHSRPTIVVTLLVASVTRFIFMSAVSTELT